MNDHIQNFLRFVSGFKLIEETESNYNGKIKLIRQLGETQVLVGSLTQSGDALKRVWQKSVNSSSADKNSRILILGLGSGTLAHLLANKFPQTHLVGVEIDPEMVRLGKSHLGLNKLTNLDIHICDAVKFCKNEKSKFDLIFMDLYRGGEVPVFLDTNSFFKSVLKLLAANGKLFINRLYYDDPTRAQAEKTIKVLEKLTSKIHLSRVFTNLIIEISYRSTQNPGYQAAGDIA